MASIANTILATNKIKGKKMRTKAQRAYEIGKADDYLRKAAKLLAANLIPDAMHKKEIQQLRKMCDAEISKLDDMEVVDEEGIIPF
jgi:hypothetical protein